MLSFNSATTTLMVFFIGLGMTGISESFKQSALTPALQTSLTSENMGSGMSLNSMMGSLGSALSACVFGVVFDAIAPNPTVISDITKASNMVFTLATVSGAIVCLLAYVFLKPKKPTETVSAT